MSEQSDSATQAIQHLDKDYNEKAPVYINEQGITIIRNSKIGTCPRELWAYWKGMEPAKQDTRAGDDLEEGEVQSDIFAEGHLHEADVKSRLEKAGWLLSGFEAEFSLNIGSIARVIGHADIYEAIHPVTKINYFGEIKSMGLRAFELFIDSKFDWSKYPTYMAQLAVGMIASGRPACIWVKCRDNGRILKPFVFEEPPVSRVDIMKKVLAIRNCVNSDTPPPCGSYRELVGNWCRFSQLHSDTEQPADFITLDGLEPVLAEYKELKETSKIVSTEAGDMKEKDRKEQLRQIIENQITKHKATGIASGKFKATKGKDSMSFNEDEFKTSHPELWLKFQTKAKSGQLRVSEVKERGGSNAGGSQ